MKAALGIFFCSFAGWAAVLFWQMSQIADAPAPAKSTASERWISPQKGEGDGPPICVTLRSPSTREGLPMEVVRACSPAIQQLPCAGESILVRLGGQAPTRGCNGPDW